jgi:hypothetical protein
VGGGCRYVFPIRAFHPRDPHHRSTGGGNPERTKSVDELGAIKAMDALAKVRKEEEEEEEEVLPPRPSYSPFP